MRSKLIIGLLIVGALLVGCNMENYQGTNVVTNQVSAAGNGRFTSSSQFLSNGHVTTIIDTVTGQKYFVYSAKNRMILLDTE